jgi:hypothetical protein
MESTEMMPTRKELIQYLGRLGEAAQELTDGGGQHSNEQTAELIQPAGMRAHDMPLI